MLNPAEEFAYSPRVRELFADMRHAGMLSLVGATHASPSGASGSQGDACVAPTIAPTVVSAEAGSREQGASIRLAIEVRDKVVCTVRYQAYGCPHFLAACESLARWLEGCAIGELPQWRWREVETELQVPIAKRARLLLLEDALRALQDKVNASPAASGVG